MRVGSLADAFRNALSSGAAVGDDARLEEALADLARRGRAAWPDVPLAPEVLAAYAGARVTKEGDADAMLAELRAEDLYLACAAATNVPQGLRAFEASLIAKTPAYLASLKPTPEIVEETKQRLLEKLFVEGEDTPPKILQYSGKGALEGWVRIAAIRTALNLLESKKASRERVDEAHAVAMAVAPGADPELEYMKATYREEFVASFREAMGGLSKRDRNLLRFAFVELLPPARIGVLYGVHRTTAMRWIEAAQEEVLARTREGLSKRLKLSPTEIEQIFDLVKSRLHITLGSLLKTGSG